MAQKRDQFSHTKWLCKYHIVFAPKYRCKVIFNLLIIDIEQILRALGEHKGVELIEEHMMPDHVHMLISLPPKYSVAAFMGYLKGKSALMIFDKHSNLKYKCKSSPKRECKSQNKREQKAHFQDSSQRLHICGIPPLLRLY